MFRKFNRWALAITCAAMVGCQEQTSVSGSVNYNGQPVEKGYITFARGSGSSFAAPIADGKYAVAKATPGEATVLVIGTRDIDFTSASSSNVALDYIAPDAKGNSRGVTVEAGSQSMDFDITGPPALK